MSTMLISKPEIPMEELFDGRLEQYGVHEFVVSESPFGSRCLTNGQDSLWIVGDRLATRFTAYGLSSPEVILAAVQELYDVAFFSEYTPAFSFDTSPQEDDNDVNPVDHVNDKEAVYELIVENILEGIPFPAGRPDCVVPIMTLIAEILIGARPELTHTERWDLLVRVAEEIANTHDVFAATWSEDEERIRSAVIDATNAYLREHPRIH